MDAVKIRKQNKEEVYVVPTLQTPLLGKPAIKAIGLAVRVKNIGKRETEPVKAFPRLFRGLGKLKIEYHIQLREEAYAVCFDLAKKSGDSTISASRG